MAPVCWRRRYLPAERSYMKLRVMIVDDHLMFRTALRLVLEADAGVEVVGEAEDGQEAVARCDQTLPDVVCMDINMPRMNGIEATRQLVAAHPGIKVIGLSAYIDLHFVQEMVNAGAVGFITKSDAGDSLLPAIHTVAEEQRTYFCPEVADILAA